MDVKIKKIHVFSFGAFSDFPNLKSSFLSS